MTTETVFPRVTRFPVEEGHIKQFARAIGDANPIYSDPAYAEKSSLHGMIAPPTFSEAANHFDENWPFRPREGQPWFGSGATPTGVSQAAQESGTAMHAETHFVYYRPVRPGMILSVRPRQGRQWTKWGARSGTLTFNEIISEFLDADNVPILECATVALQTERLVSNDSSAPTGAAIEKPETLDPCKSYPVLPLSRSSICVGDILRRRLVSDLTRTQIIQYAGASGDFSPQHTDEIYNTRVAGYPTVFAHGMLTMGMVGTALTDVVGDGRLKTFGFQFRRQVWPGDSLFATIETTGVAANDATLAFSVTNQHDQLIGSGYATATVEG